MPHAATLITTSPWPGLGSGKWAISRCLYSESRRAFTGAGPLSERDSSFPGNEIVLREHLRLSADFSAGNLNYAFKDRFPHFLNIGLARDDAARVDVDDVGHTLRETRISRDFQNWRNRVSCRRTQPGREENHIRARPHLR